MKQIFFLFSLIIATSLFAYEDSDLDGVDDIVDKCPNTPFSELVDINGCTTKTLFSDHHYDIIIGTSYSDSDYQTLNKADTLATSIQVDYYYKNFSIGASTSYFSTKGDTNSDKGLYDSYINFSYQFMPKDFFIVRVLGGFILPTYSSSFNNNNIDYYASINLSYNIDKVNIFGGISYTLIEDDDVNSSVTLQYQNTLAFSAGAGYYVTDSLYTSLSYNTSDSIYQSIEDIKTLSLYAYYSIDEHLFGTLSYAKGISDSASDNYLSMRIGYYF